MAKRKKKKKDKSDKSRGAGKDKKRKSIGNKPKSSKRKKKRIDSGRKRKKGKKKPKGPSVGPKPVDPTTGKPKKKLPKKRKRKWPPKRKRKKGSDGGQNDSSLLQYSDFAPFVGTFFQVIDFNPTIQIELVEVAALQPLDLPDDLPGEVRTNPFSVLFLGPLNVDIPQGVYTLEHATMDTMVVLLVPIGPPDTSGGFQIILESIFS